MNKLATLSVLMLHARDANDPMLHHEFECFVERSGLYPEQVKALNLTTTAVTEKHLEHADAVMIGGSGSYSVVKGGFQWHEPMLVLMRRLVELRKPTFASCFGFQALSQALGGTIETQLSRAELGTFEMKLTDQGKNDPIFGQLPELFDAQLGHNDSATVLPDQLEVLVSSERCMYQAVRVKGTPVYATQFHPELMEEDNITRYMSYIENYLKPGETIEHARTHAAQMHRPSPHANRLIRLFLEHTFGD